MRPRASRPGTPRRHHRLTVTGSASLLLVLAACADPNAPASELTFFDGVRDMFTGNQAANTRALETRADAAEQQAQRSGARLASANADVQSSNAQVAAARSRLARVDRQIDQQRERLRTLERSRQSPAAQEEAARLQRESQALDAERRRLQGAPGGPSSADVQRLEQQTQDLRRALDRLQSL